MTMLLFDAVGSEVLETPCAGGRAVAFSRRSPFGTVNEDAAGVLPIDHASAVLVVADGMGGASAGEHAARLAVEAIVEATFAAEGVAERLRTAVLDGIERANERILDLGLGAATTLASVEIAAGSARPYHVGDSFILLVGGRGRVKWRTVAHSPVGYGLEAGFLDESSALAHDERHLVSNVLGSAEMRIEIGPPLPLAPRDTLLVASDGLADNLTTDEIAARLCRGDLEQAVVALAETATQRMAKPGEGMPPGKPDDLTILAFRPRS